MLKRYFSENWWKSPKIVIITLTPSFVIGDQSEQMGFCLYVLDRTLPVLLDYNY
jgi:hypothetical protein